MNDGMKKTWMILGGLALLGGAYFGYEIMSAYQRTDDLTKRSNELTAQLDETTSQKQKKAAANLSMDEVRAEVLNRFTGQIGEVVGSAGLQLSQMNFDATSNPVPGAPAKGDKGGTQGWGMNSVSFTVQGPTPQIYLAIKNLSELDTPFQVQEIALNRMVNSATGEVGVTANIKLSVLIRKGGPV